VLPAAGGAGAGALELDVVGLDVVAPEFVVPDVVVPDVVRRDESELGILTFWPTYTHELTFMPLAMARRCVVIR
jgi:hypothetical protein